MAIKANLAPQVQVNSNGGSSNDSYSQPLPTAHQIIQGAINDARKELDIDNQRKNTPDNTQGKQITLSDIEGKSVNMTIISCIYDKEVLKGFLIVVDDGEVLPLPLEAIPKVAKYFKSGVYNMTNADLDSEYKTFVGKSYMSLTNYPRIDNNYNILTKNALTAQYVVTDDNEDIGVVFYNAIGAQFRTKIEKLETLCGVFSQTNFKLTPADTGHLTVICKDGSPFPKIKLQPKLRSARYRSANGDNEEDYGNKEVLKLEDDDNKLPIIGVYNLDDVKNSDIALPAQQKMQSAFVNMRKISPYYSTVYSALDKLLTPGLGTMGVTENKLHYDLVLPARLSVGALTFVLIHEVLHIVMQHSLRRGNRNPRLWNVATDLYINSVIEEDFGCMFGEGDKDVIGDDGKVLGTIGTPSFGLFFEKIGETIDLSRDTPETIYAKLEKENPQMVEPSSDFTTGGMPQNNRNGGESQSLTPAQQRQIIEDGIKDVLEGCDSAIMDSQGDKQAQNDAAQDIRDGAKKLQDGINQVADSNKKVNEGRETGNDSLTSEGMQGIKDGKDKMREGATQMNQGVDKMEEPATDTDPMSMDQMRDAMDIINAALNAQGSDSDKSSESDSDGNTPGRGNNSDPQDSHGGKTQDSNGNDSDSADSKGARDGNGGDGGNSGNSSNDSSSSNNGNQSGMNGNGSQNDMNNNGGNGQSRHSNSAPDIDDNGDYKDFGVEQVTVTYNGKKLTGNMMRDIATRDNSGTKDSKKENVDASKYALQRIDTKCKMEEQKLGESLMKNAGSGAQLAKRFIDFGLSEGIDWRVLMKNICVDKPKRMYTMAMPNVEYMNSGMILAARHKIGKPTRAAKFVVCIDVSGSVSQTELNYFLSEVNTLATKYDVEAELVYWSTTIGNAGQFSTMKDLLSIEPVSDGGTDVKCVFQYLSGEIEVNGRREPLRVRDIKGVFIITDGYFSKNYGEYAQYFGNKTVWLIDGNPVQFDPCFGRVLGFEHACEEQSRA